jgi:hypothetical protein
MKLKGSHWTKGARQDQKAGVVTSETKAGKVKLKLDSGHTEELHCDELLREWVRVTSPEEAAPR